MNWSRLKKYFRKNVHRKRSKEIFPDEIFLDSSNLPEFDTDQFEGRIEKPIAKRNLFWLGLFFLLAALIFLSRLSFLQVAEGQTYAKRSENNRLEGQVIISNRGVITDRNGTNIAWNEMP